MSGGFTRGLVVGSILVASVGMIMNNDMMRPRNRKKMFRTGRTLLRKSSGIISDVVDAFR
ncbi:MAG: YtxH domain-containing protein [Ruminiclostridium sp.]|nr:YtxH domain-containing protein [Ruminiclostridium sp.]